MTATYFPNYPLLSSRFGRYKLSLYATLQSTKCGLFLTLQRILSDQGPLEASGPRPSRSGAQNIVQVTGVPTRANFFGLNSVIPPKIYIPTKACWSRINHVYPCKTKHRGYFHLEHPNLPTRKGSFHSQIRVNNQ